MKTKAIIGILFVAIALIIGGASAAKTVVERNNGLSANAGFENVDVGAGIVTYTFVSADAGKEGTFVYIAQDKYDSYGNYLGYSSGSKMLESGDSFEENKQLKSATLSVQRIEMGTWKCDSETYECNYVITALNDTQVSWIGVGNPTVYDDKYTVKNKDYMVKYSSGSTSRNALAIGAADGASFGTMNWAGLYSYKSAVINIEK